MNLLINRRTESLSLVLGALLSIGAGGQQPPPAPDPIESNLPQPNWVKLYDREQGIAEPLLNQPVYFLQSECKGRKLDGSVRFSFVVDSNGFPRNVVFERALAHEIDLLALKLMLSRRFQPAVLNGSPVAVGRSVEMRLRVCAEQTPGPYGKIDGSLRLRFPPEEKFEDWHHPPAQVNLAPISMPPGMQADHERISSHFTSPKELAHPAPPNTKGRDASFSFNVLVDEHGIPQVVETLKATDQTLLPQFIQALRDVRYIPARKDGMPVPAHITVTLKITRADVT